MRSTFPEPRWHFGLRALCAGAWLCFSAACARQHESSAPGVTPDLATSLCRYLERCLEGSLKAFAGGTVASCAEVMRWARLLNPVAQARDAQACAAELDDRDCPIPILSGLVFFRESAPLVTPGPESACLPAPPAHAAPEPEGAPCRARMDCGEGMYCELDVPLREVEFVACGHCARARRQGEACGPSQLCSYGLAGLQGLSGCTNGRCAAPVGTSCDADSECQSRRCDNGSCAAPAALRAVDMGKSCEGSGVLACGEDITLACIGETCRVRRDLRESCQASRDCRLGLTCVSGRCEPLQSPAGEDEPCGLYNECVEGTWCFNGVCKRLAGPGEDCSQRICSAGHYCPSCGERRCSERGGDGASCLQNSECASGFCGRALSPDCHTEGLTITCDLPDCERPPGTCQEPPSSDVCQ